MDNKVYQKSKQQGFTPSKKEKKKNTRKVAGIILLCLMAFWSLASILGVFSFVQNNLKTAKADSVQVGYKFNSSNIYTVCAQIPVENWNETFLHNGRIPFSAYDDGGVNRFINFRFNAESGYGDVGIRITFDFISYQNNTPIELRPYLIGHPGIKDGLGTDAGTSNGFFLEETESCAIGLFNEVMFPGGLNIGASSFSGFFEFYVSPGFNCDVVSARYYGEQVSDIPVPGSNVFDCANYFYYYDSNGNYLRLTSRFGSNPTYQNQFIYKDRYYYLTSETTGQIQFNLGKEQGIEEGKQIGYKNGYDVGFTAGKDVGFNDGVSSANNYSFLGLMGAIVDAPISAISGLFNFNILGINLWTFFTGLLTCALIIAVIRLIL